MAWFFIPENEAGELFHPKQDGKRTQMMFGRRGCTDPTIQADRFPLVLCMKQPQYNRYERGFRDIPTDVLIALADLYNTSADYILGRVDAR